MLAAASCHLHTPYMLLSVLHTVQGSLPIHGGDVGVSYTLDTAYILPICSNLDHHRLVEGAAELYHIVYIQYIYNIGMRYMELIMYIYIYTYSTYRICRYRSFLCVCCLCMTVISFNSTQSVYRLYQMQYEFNLWCAASLVYDKLQFMWWTGYVPSRAAELLFFRQETWYTQYTPISNRSRNSSPYNTKSIKSIPWISLPFPSRSLLAKNGSKCWISCTDARALSARASHSLCLAQNWGSSSKWMACI